VDCGSATIECVGQHEQVLKVAPVTDQPRPAYRAASAKPLDLARARNMADAKLLNLVRAGNTAAYDVLFSRHVQAARRLAQIVVVPAEVDHVVAEAFAEVRDATMLGRGPGDAFRPYLLTVLRRVSIGWQPTGTPASPAELPGPGRPASGPEMAAAGLLPVVRALRALPERWIAVLWHAGIEQTDTAEVAKILGLGPGAVEALRRRALEGLRQAYLHVRSSELADPDCQAAAARFTAFVQDTASRRDRTMVMKHLRRCGGCRAVYADFTDIDVTARTVLARVVLGTAASSYVHDAHRAAAMADTAEFTGVQPAAGSSGSGGGAPASAGGALLSPAGRPRHTSLRLRWIGAVAVAAVAVIVTFGLALAGPGSRLAPPHDDQPAQAAPPPTSATAPQPAAKPRVPAATPSRSPAPAGTSPAAVGIAPLAASSAAPAPAQLSATVGVGPSDHGGTDRVEFSVADTGGTATGGLTVSLGLPGGSMVSGRSGSESAGSHGWSCQQTQSGASCEHDGIEAGGQAQGFLMISVSDPDEACGQAVSMTAVSGSISDSATSPEGIQCQG
jgi:DNA-directed RNA polymerase specialized sigma24 family protein